MRPNASRAQIGLGVAIALAAAFFGFSFGSLYTAPDHSRGFTEAMRAFLLAGLAQDSAAVAELDVSPTALRWVLDRGRRNPDFLETLVAGLEASGTRRGRDTAEVTFHAKDLTGCGPDALTVYFSGLPSSLRIEEVKTGCDAGRP
jgi:hypothetical protein